MDTRPLLSNSRRDELDAVASELLRLCGVERAPVPIEEILRRPPGDMWQPDLDDLSLQSFEAHERYAARPTIARLVARYIALADWGRQRRLTVDSEFTADEARYLGRALLMPKEWMSLLLLSERNPASVRLRFHVPEAEAAARLAELNLIASRPESAA